MVYDIIEQKTTENGFTHLLVHFWTGAESRAFGDPPILVNDFLINHSGIDDTIQLYMKRAEAKKYSGDHTPDATKKFYVDGVEVPQK